MAALVTNIASPTIGTAFGAPYNFDKVANIGLGYKNDESGFNIINRDFAPAVAKTLTKSAATSVVDINVPSNSVIGGEFFYTMYATDGTDYQVLRGHIPFTAVNKGGTLTANLGTAVEQTSLSAGTFTNTVTNVTGTNKITLKLNAVPSVTPTTLNVTYRILIDGASGTATAL